MTDREKLDYCVEQLARLEPLIAGLEAMMSNPPPMLAALMPSLVTPNGG